MKHKIKILFFLPSFAGGGAEKVAITFLNNLPYDDYEVHLTVLSSMGKLKNSINKNIILHDLKTKRLRYSLIKIIKNIKFVKPNIIFSTFININIFLLMSKIFYKKIKFVIRAESVPSTHFKFLPYSNLYKFLYNIFYKRSDVLIASCKIIFNEFKLFKIDKNSIKLLPNPVENLLQTNQNKLIRQSGNGIRVVAAGRLSEQKGYDYLLEAISKVSNDIHCTILGEGILEKDLKLLAGKLKINDKVKFQGYVDDPYPYLNGADALLITSNFEGLPNIALESLSLGTPVIATPNSGGVKELKYAKIVERGDDFVAAVNNIKLKKIFSKTSLLENRFNLNNVMDSLNNIFKNLRDI